MKNYILIISIVLILANISIFAQPKPKGTPIVPKAEVVEILDPSNDFATKGLPTPIINGKEISDELAIELAKKISVYDEDSLPNLMTALLKSGFYIQDENLKTLYAPGFTNDSGMAFYDFEVAGMYRASQFGGTMTIEKMATVLTGKISGASPKKAAKALLADILSGTKSRNPNLRFISRLVIELGKNLPTPVDLQKAAPENAVISLIQASLIERHLMADLIYQYDTFSKVAGISQNRNLFEKRNQFPMFVNASFSRKMDTCENIAGIENLVKTFNSIKSNYDKALEKGAHFTKFFKALFGEDFDYDEFAANRKIPSFEDVLKLLLKEETVKKVQDTLEKLNSGVEILNAVSSITKFAVAHSNIKADITVEQPNPLIRTKSDRETGETRTITAKFTMDLPKSDKINCIGKALGMTTGLSLELPNNGAMKGVPVAWELVADGSGYRKYLTAPVYADALNKTDTSKQVTDDNGESKIKLTGKPQSKNLVNSPVVPLERTVLLRVSVAQEAMNFKDDVKDLPGTAEGIADFFEKFATNAVKSANTISLASNLISFIPKMLAKAKLKNFAVKVPIRDWQPCTEDWGGTINIKIFKSKTEVIKSSRLGNGNGTGNGFKKYLTDINVAITLNPRTQEEIDAKMQPKPADIYVNGIISEHTELNEENNPCCEHVDGSFSFKTKEGLEKKINDFVKEQVPLNVRATERDYTLSIGVPTAYRIKAKDHFYKEVESNCEVDRGESEDRIEESTWGLTGLALPDGRYGNRFVNTAGELLQGEKEYNAGDTKYKFSWALARCKK